MVNFHPITSFSGEYSFLSNFYPAPTPYDGLLYPSAEHAFQAAKTIDSADRLDIQAAETPSLAKHMGRRVLCRPDWEKLVKQEKLKYYYMFRIVQNKFRFNPPLLKRLLATSFQDLVEGNTWQDYYWGKVLQKDNFWRGSNKLGIILMELRNNHSEYF